MGKRLTILLVAFGITAAATIAALVVVKHGSIFELVGHAPPKQARFDDPTLAAVQDGGGAPRPAGAATRAPDRPGADAAAPRTTGTTGTTGGHAAAQSRTAAVQSRSDAPGVRGAHRGGTSAPGHHGNGALLVVCRPSCRIFVDGRRRGRSPPLKALELPVGSHHLRVVDAAGHVQKRVVLVAPNRVNRVTMVFGDGKTTRPFRQETGTESW